MCQDALHYILARLTVFDIGFYDDLAVMCLPFNETPEITPELADYLLTLSFEVGFGYLAKREGELAYCSEFGTKGINLTNFDSILRGMLDGVAYLREDEVLGAYVPGPLTPFDGL